MKLYRIYTEDLQDGMAQQITSQSFEAFTILRGKGIWRGASELSMVIEIITDKRAAVYAVAKTIKSWGAQEAVLVTEQDVNMELV